jgi:hypothetical protein
MSKSDHGSCYVAYFAEQERILGLLLATSVHVRPVFAPSSRNRIKPTRHRGRRSGSPDQEARTPSLTRNAPPPEPLQCSHQTHVTDCLIIICGRAYGESCPSHLEKEWRNPVAIPERALFPVGECGIMKTPEELWGRFPRRTTPGMNRVWVLGALPISEDARGQDECEDGKR